MSNEAKILKINLLTIVTERTTDKLIIHWIGECDEKEPEKTIYPFLKEIIDTFKSHIEIDFTQLSFMSSSTIAFLFFIFKKLNKKNIKTTIVYSKDNHWQQISFKTLEKAKSIIKNIKVIGK